MYSLSVLLITLAFSGSVFGAENTEEKDGFLLKWNYGGKSSACDDNKDSCRIVAVCKVGGGSYKRIGVYKSTTRQVEVQKSVNCNDKVSCYVYASNGSGRSEKASVEASKQCAIVPKNRTDVLVQPPNPAENLRIIFE